MKIKGIRYTGPILDNSGYAKACRGNILALHSAGVPLNLNPISFENISPDLGPDGEVIKKLINNGVDYNVNLTHTTPEFWSKYKLNGVKNIGYTIWETTKLHPAWPKYINEGCDKVLVGCTWNKEVFKESGVNVPIGVVPHGINIEEFDNVTPFNVEGVDKDQFMFYSIFQWCYDDKTRVLTKDGFKYFKDLSYSDEIATLNKETDELEYHVPEKIVKFRRKDKMLKLTSNQFNVCVTPDHKMVVKEHVKDGYGVDPGDVWKLKPLNELLIINKDNKIKVSGKYRTKKNCKWTGLKTDVFEVPKCNSAVEDKKECLKLNMPLFLKFFGWYISEGSLEKSSSYYRVAITQTKSEENINEIWNCVKELGFTPIKHGKDTLFNSKEMYYYLLQFGKCYEKFIPKELKGLCKEYIMILLTSLFKGDGSFHRNGTWCKYVTTSKKLAEDVQECLLKVGYSGAISTSDPTLNKPGTIDGREIKGKRLQYTVSVNRMHNEPSMYYADLEEIDYDGYVHCATVPNHTMLVEREGKVIFSGNTERKHPLAMIKAYWYAFTGNKDVVLVLKTYRSDYSEPEKGAIRGTITRLKRITPMEHHPKVVFISNMLSEQEMSGLHARGDCYVSLDRGEGFGLCVGKNTKISVPDGIKYAKDIIVGDEVLSVDGKFHKVKDVSSKYVKNGLIISTKLHEDIVVSNDHPFLVGKDITKHKRYNNTVEDIEKCLEWRESKYLSVGDYVAIPKPVINECVDKIDISTIINNDCIIEGNLLYLKNGYSPKNTKHSYKNLVSMYGHSKKIFESAVKHIKSGTEPTKGTDTRTAFEVLDDIGYEVKTPNKINRYININEDVLSLFGWYLAEGSTNNDTFLEIDLHRKEYAIALYLSAVFQNEFGVSKDSILVEKYNNKSRVIVSSKIISCLFSTMFGKGANNKHIPGWLFKKGNSLLPMIKGLFGGDGHNSGSTYALTTTSISLAYQVKLLLNSFGYCPRVANRGKSKIGNYDVYIVSIANNNYLSFIGKDSIDNEKKFFIATDNYFLVKVTKIKELLYNDNMFDFSVEDGESFVGNGILLHNCPFSAGAAKKPIVITGFGGATEYAKEDNSYLVNYSLTPVYGMPWSPWYRGDQLWAEPDVLDGSNKMKYVYEHQKDAKEKGEKLHDYIKDNFSWECIANKIVTEIEMFDE